MHIAFITNEYVTESTFDGGLANYLRRVGIALVRRGHHVEVFTESIADESIEQDGITVHRVAVPHQTIKLWSRLTRGYYSHDFIRIIPFGLKLRQRVLQRHRQAPFDIIQVPNLFVLGFGLALSSPVPYVVRASSYQPHLRTYNRLGPYEFSRSTKMIDRFERFQDRRAAGVYAPSDLIAGEFRKFVRPDVDVIHPPFMLDTTITDDSVYCEQLTQFRYLLYFGTLKVLKGIVTLADALKVVLPRYPDLHIVLVGKDSQITPERSALAYVQQQAGEHVHRVHHFGKLHHAQLYPIIRGAAGVIIPSRIDNFPNTCLEAMAFGRVVIGTRGASLDEMMDDGISGVLVPLDSPGALAEAMGRVWQMSDEERARIGAAAQARVQTLRPEAACAELERYFQKVIDSRRRRRQ